MGITAPSQARLPAVRPSEPQCLSGVGEGSWPIMVGAVVCITAAAALFSLIGSDADWLAALGRFIAVHHTIPTRVPFASASLPWPNPFVLAELTFHGLQSTVGPRGLMVAQLFAVAIGFAAVACDAVAGGSTAGGAAAAIALVAIGSLPSLDIVRGQLFSLALFPLLVLLLRSDARKPSGRIWLLVPLLALWSNLNGVAILGVGTALTYLVLANLRARPPRTLAIGFASVASMFLTPAGLKTASFYKAYFTTVPAQRGLGLSAPLTVTHPFDVALIITALTLAIRFRRARPPVWEIASVLILSAATLHASRSGIWLLYFMAAPAARRLAPSQAWGRVIPVLGVASAAALAYGVARGPLPTGASDVAIRQAMALSHGTPILAEDILDEQVSLARGQIWAGNPIEAFSKRVQTVYADWLEGLPSGRRALVPEVRVVITKRNSPAARLMNSVPGFVRVYADQVSAIYERIALRTGGASPLATHSD